MNINNNKLGIDPKGTVLLKSNIKKKISELTIGDNVQTLGGFNTITNIIKIQNHDICYLNGSMFSKKNPVKYRDIWCLPKSITLPVPKNIELYVIELSSNENDKESYNTIIVDGIICATSGFNPIISIPEKQPFEMIYREYC
jgi:hypothetical protein